MRFFYLFIALIVLSACSSTSAVTITDVEGEYIIVGRDLTPIASTQKGAEDNAVEGAKEFCTTLGKEYKKKYVLTTGMLPGKPADATLFFRCVSKELLQANTPTDSVNKLNVPASK